MKRAEDKEMQLIANVVMGGLLLCVAAWLTGCGLMGVRKADLWGAKFEFAEGLDFSIGANSVDHVDNRRGVSRLEDKAEKAVVAKQ